MDARRFDMLTKTFAARRLSRRSALWRGGTAVVATTLSAAGLTRATAAQNATPSARPAMPADIGENGAFLFVQTAQSGTWTPKSGEAGVYILTLHESTDQTVYFSDRPQRIVGVTPMQQFLDGLGFAPTNPPNAALVAQTASGEDVLVIELLKPVYDAAAGTLTYDARVLENYADEGLAFLAQQQHDDTMEATFKDASLFIDDCPNGTLQCIKNNTIYSKSIGCCWNSGFCHQCHTEDCTSIPECAAGDCTVWKNSPGCPFA